MQKNEGGAKSGKSELLRAPIFKFLEHIKAQWTYTKSIFLIYKI